MQCNLSTLRYLTADVCDARGKLDAAVNLTSSHFILIQGFKINYSLDL